MALDVIPIQRTYHAGCFLGALRGQGYLCTDVAWSDGRRTLYVMVPMSWHGSLHARKLSQYMLTVLRYSADAGLIRRIVLTEPEPYGERMALELTSDPGSADGFLAELQRL